MRLEQTPTTSAGPLKVWYTRGRSAASHRLHFRRVLWRGIGLALSVFWAALPSQAQQSAQKLSQLEVFGGYSYMRFDSKTIGFADKSNMNGWNVAASYHLFKNLSVTGDVSGHYASEIQLYNFLIGPQLSFPRGKMTYFGRFLIGKGRDHVTPVDGHTSIGRAIVFGGGADRTISPRWSFRVVQIDFLSTHTFATNESNLRVSTGLVYQFGGR